MSKKPFVWSFDTLKYRVVNQYFSVAKLSIIILVCALLPAKSLAQSDAIQMHSGLSLQGTWITELNGSTMLDPQTSGLIADDKVWWTISDASAHESQTQRLHLIDKSTKQVVKKYGPYVLSKKVSDSCFADYLSTEPDFEAIVFHPFKYDAWILVTEDASRGKPLSARCQETFSDTGSTVYPTVLVEVLLRDGQLIVSGARAVKFAEQDKVGDFPNDGIEGMAVGRDQKLYMALEKDANGHPRIFYVDLDPETFNSAKSFIQAKDAELNLPKFEQGNHPINGMDIYFPDEDSKGFLIAAARNDNELWVIDIEKSLPTRVIPLSFFAPSMTESCPSVHIMDNASLEGVAVDGDTLVLINDPWRKNYLKNAKCEGDIALYERMSPLIFTTPIEKSWVSAN
jgi:hypothetical protein